MGVVGLTSNPKASRFIGRYYEVFEELGHGGFGVVYLAYSHQTGVLYALKTFKDEYLRDAKTKALFRREANIWVELERHPYLVSAYHVDEVEGRLYIAMEYIRKNRQGLNCLADYLRCKPIGLAQSLRWAVQFCHGMEYAYSRGIRCHRDIKPANIMIDQKETVKITDFGLAGALNTLHLSGTNLNCGEGRIEVLSTLMEGKGCGTVTHMPPEQFINASSCDQRSDVYSFGVVLYQLATGGRLPFLAALPMNNSAEEHLRFGRQMRILHSNAPVPKVNSPLYSIICRCLEKDPAKRYPTFEALRVELEPLLRLCGQEIIAPPKQEAREFWEWNVKGFSLYQLGRFGEAIKCYEAALKLNPNDALAWNNKGNCLGSLGQVSEAIDCLDKALGLDPNNSMVWNNKGSNLHRLARFNEALECYDKAIEADPKYEYAWINKAHSLSMLGKFTEAIKCYDNALIITPQSTQCWINKAECFDRLGQLQEAVECYDEALNINPKLVLAWSNKGNCLQRLGDYLEALRCYEKILRITPQSAPNWETRAVIEDKLGLKAHAIRSYRKFIELTPSQPADNLGKYRQRIHELEKQLAT